MSSIKTKPPKISKIKVGIFVSHPIQYFSPLWRNLEDNHSLNLIVFYLSDSGARDRIDTDFGRNITWDVPLLNGYQNIFLKRDAQPSRRWSLFIPGLISLFEKEFFDCVVITGYSMPFEWQVLWAARRRGIKIVMRGEFAPSADRNFLKGLIRKKLLRFIYRQVDAFAVIGKQARRHLEEHGVDPERMVSSPYSVDSSLFSLPRNPRRIAALQRELGLDPTDKIVLFSGKLISRKKVDTLIKTMGLLMDCPQIKLLLVGDGKLRGGLQKMAEKIAPGRVIFTGFINQTHLPDYFDVASAFVLPSEYETWGLVVNEAMHRGLPVFATDKVGCVADLVLPKVNGDIFFVGDATTLSVQLRGLFHDPVREKRYSLNTKKIIKRYTSELAAKGLKSAILKAVRNKRSSQKIGRVWN